MRVNAAPALPPTRRAAYPSYVPHGQTTSKGGPTRHLPILKAVAAHDACIGSIKVRPPCWGGREWWS